MRAAPFPPGRRRTRSGACESAMLPTAGCKPMASWPLRSPSDLLGVLLSSLITTGYLAFFQTKVALELYVDPAKVDAQDPAKGNFRGYRPRRHDEPVPAGDDRQGEDRAHKDLDL